MHLIMKTVLLTLLLGLATADEYPVKISKSSGALNTIYLASTNLEKISENGPFRVFAREFKFASKEVFFNFFAKVNGECTEMIDRAKKIHKNVYITDYAGNSVVTFVDDVKNAVIVDIVNMDENGTISRINAMFGKGNEVNQEDFEKFKQLTKKNNIPEENILEIITFDTCPRS